MQKVIPICLVLNSQTRSLILLDVYRENCEELYIFKATNETKLVLLISKIENITTLCLSQTGRIVFPLRVCELFFFPLL